ncbi:MAG TPA: hypothetical protein PLR57_07365, partial [Clostridia bacterium]|nr:hypothetical protein [Clostridia bacterium]
IARNRRCRQEKTAVSVRSGRYISGLRVFPQKESHCLQNSGFAGLKKATIMKLRIGKESDWTVDTVPERSRKTISYFARVREVTLFRRAR